MIKTKISSKIGSISCVGISGEFPFKHGNYCTNSENYYLSNIWGENLQFLNENDYLPDGKIEVLLFQENDTNYAYVIDDRIPENTLHAPYFCGIKTSNLIIRHHHKIPADKCICDYDIRSMRSASNKGIIGSFCTECGTTFVHQQEHRGVFRVLCKDESRAFDGSNWVLSYFENNVFKKIPCMTIIPHEDIIKIDDNRIHEFGSCDNQRSAISCSDFTFVGELERKKPD